MMTEDQRTLALGLLEINAIRFGQFRLKLHEKNPSAPLSPIYVDLRLLRSFPDLMDLAAKIYLDITCTLQFELFADVPTAATPIVALLSHETRVPMISPRKNEKTHGVRRPIDGTFKPQQTVLLVDDLITLADSKLEAIEVLEDNQLTVVAVSVLLDREQGGVRELESRGYGCRVAYRLTELLDYYLDEERLTTADYQRTLEYLDVSRRSEPN